MSDASTPPKHRLRVSSSWVLAGPSRNLTVVAYLKREQKPQPNAANLQWPTFLSLGQYRHPPLVGLFWFSRQPVLHAILGLDTDEWESASRLDEGSTLDPESEFPNPRLKQRPSPRGCAAAGPSRRK
ncbi:hypothetical protein MIND_00147300 [Mycena indigotica]|uniref:Uncharacterized protein n=1 Tax=Mycena indigotica TaxID=2126181 RepID=A0A8H6TGJ5_9AGAR|nr:uncharacterized protein MIND_00147300 [Mycena indigotica]KAF7316286.1 hypothetical protein MIND_00147300 [Mycena indigotica]